MKKIIILTTFILLITVRCTIAQIAGPTVETTKLSENLYKFFTYIDLNRSVNIYALIGNDGTILIDAGFDNAAEQINDELKKITNKPVRWIINTHYDDDHTLANASFGKGATVIAHQSSRDILERYAGFPKEALPNLTFTDSLKIYVNGEEIDMHYSPGHTMTDIIVEFKKAGIVFVGDLIFAESFPFIHSGGNTVLLEKTLNQILTKYDDKTRFLPGHGPEMNKKEVSAYFEMFKQTKKLVIHAIKQGIDPEKAKEQKLFKDWESWNSKIFPGLNADGWIDNLYAVLDESKSLSACTLLKKQMENGGLKAMLTKYKELKQNKGKKYFFFEREINNWGYTLLGENKMNAAIEVFKINTEMFPNSSNAFDSLAEAYMNSGNKELAIKNYEKSLELNPQNTNALEQLKKLGKK